MSTVQELVAVGKELGLDGEDLRKFIKEQHALESEERLKEREAREKEKEYERQEKEKERQEKEKDQAYQRQEKEKDRALRKMELEVQREQMKTTASTPASSVNGDGDEEVENVATVSKKIRGPKMTVFDEKDNTDSYLNRFERYAELQGWLKDGWAIYLAALLKGAALDVCARLPSEQSNDYKVFKAALLKRYVMTEEGYKQRFYDSKPEKGESPQQFITRLDSYLCRWLELAEIEQSFNGLKTMLVKEQYIATCAKPLELFLRERAVTDLDTLAKLAEQYQDAHGSKLTQQRESGVTNPRSRVVNNGASPAVD